MALISKEKLRSKGFSENHFRSTSKKQDIQRGFAEYVHLSILDMPPILQAKLQKGFPHFEVKIASRYVDEQEYLLCRFNIAKTRRFVGAKSEPEESECNGRYYENKALPVAMTAAEKEGLLSCNLGKNMIEVLVPNNLRLNDQVIFSFFSDSDLTKASEIAEALDIQVTMEIHPTADRYSYNQQYSENTYSFLDKALLDENWKGNGLEFDNL